jgi:hypothetical protein
VAEAALSIQKTGAVQASDVSTARVPTRARPVSVGLQPCRVKQRWSVPLDRQSALPGWPLIG